LRGYREFIARAFGEWSVAITGTPWRARPRTMPTALGPDDCKITAGMV
jgi:hypothetical protein